MTYLFEEGATRIPSRTETITVSPPLLELSPEVLTRDSNDQAIEAGVEVAVIDAIKSGVAYWRVAIAGTPEKVAPVLGVSAEEIRAAHARALNKVFGRGANGFPSGSAAGFGGIRNS